MIFYCCSIIQPHLIDIYEKQIVQILHKALSSVGCSAFQLHSFQTVQWASQHLSSPAHKNVWKWYQNIPKMKSLASGCRVPALLLNCLIAKWQLWTQINEPIAWVGVGWRILASAQLLCSCRGSVSSQEDSEADGLTILWLESSFFLPTRLFWFNAFTLDK